MDNCFKTWFIPICGNWCEVAVKNVTQHIWICEHLRRRRSESEGRRSGVLQIKGVFTTPRVSRRPPFHHLHHHHHLISDPFLLPVKGKLLHSLHSSNIPALALPSLPLSLYQHHLLLPLLLFRLWLSVCLSPSLALAPPSFALSLLPLSFPACSTRPATAGGSPEPPTPSRGPPAQAGWEAGTLAHLQQTHSHTHTDTHTDTHTRGIQLAVLVCLRSISLYFIFSRLLLTILFLYSFFSNVLSES